MLDIISTSRSRWLATPASPEQACPQPAPPARASSYSSPCDVSVDCAVTVAKRWHAESGKMTCRIGEGGDKVGGAHGNVNHPQKQVHA